MGVNKVKYGENVVLDISSDTVTADKLLQGYTAHDNTGALIIGTATGGAEQGNVWQDVNGYLHLDDESGISLQTKSVTPTESTQTVTPDNGYYALEEVNVSAISSSYVGSGITRRSSSDMTVSGATVTAPSGYYSASASKSVASGTAGTPTATKGTVSNHSVSVTPSVTNTTGYITGGTKSGTAVSVSASELVSGTLPITQNGTADVTNYASVNVSVPSSGEDVPVFTLDISTNPPTATCDKTFAECEAYISSNNTVAILNVPLASMTLSMAVYNYIQNYIIYYAIYDANGLPFADIGWVKDSQMTFFEPSNLNGNLPTIATAYSNGTLQATIDTSTSTRYLNIPSGYYPQNKYYTLSAMATGTAGTPTATKGTVSNHSVSVTPSVTNTTGYITGSTKTGTAVTVSASELVSGTLPITQNGTADVTNYASVNVNVSGGGGTVKMGALRSDAELVQSWTSDKLFVQDMSGTIPAYTTSSSTIVSSQNLTPTVNVDFTTYDYILVYRCLNTPIYSNGTTMGTGKLIHSLEAGTCELVSLPEAEYVSGYITGKANAVVVQNNKKTVYAASSSSVNIVTSSTIYGIYNNFNSPLISNPNTANGTITAKSPSVIMRGSSTYFSSTYWGALTDIRLQYVIELWRSPKASQINGYAVGSQEIHIIDCAAGNGTLT